MSMRSMVLLISHRIKFVLTLHMMFDEHDVVYRFLYNKRRFEQRGALLHWGIWSNWSQDLMLIDLVPMFLCLGHDLAEVVVNPVQVPLKLVIHTFLTTR